MFEIGKMYLCLVCPYDNFTEGMEYLAITDDELIDNYGVQAQICDDNCKFKKAVKPSVSVKAAKSRCNHAILDAIIEFEKTTGFDVTDIEYNKTSTPICVGHNMCSKDTVNQQWVTIVISL